MDLNVLSFMNDVVLPIFIVVFLPVVIVLIVQIFRNRNLARKTDVIKLAIEKGANLDVNKMMEALESTGKRRKGPVGKSQYLLEKMTTGIILFLAGLAVILVTALTGSIVPEGKWAFYLFGTIVSIVGAGLLIMFFAGRKMLPEDKAE
ncbi:MAG TPA: hypothetical protein IAC09_08805 [Candidatus Cryptobacteroides intestinipullorum]|nr:hypothetical protein [Candidatus Cryptobacteroides intestinipullorum]